VLGVLTLASLMACWRPVRAAGQIDPVALLKEE
jgi:ABC-type lipoprotein release transport system permease subunit